MSFLNKTLFAPLLCLSLLACGEKTFDEHLETAKKNINDKDFNAATIELKNAIRQSPEHAEPRFLLGKIYFYDGQFAPAVKEFSRAYETNQSNEEYLTYLARAYYLNSDFTQLIALSERTYHDLLIYLTAVINIQEEQVAPAKSAFSNLSIGTDNANFAYLAKLSKAFIAIINEDYTKAQEQVELVLSEDELNLEALLIKAQLAGLPNNAKLGIDAYQQLVKLFPKHHIFKLFLASYLVENDQFPDAEKLVAELIKLSPDNGIVNQLKAQLLFREKDYELAKKHAEKAIQATLDNPINRLIAGISNYQLKKYEQAYYHLNQIQNRLPKTHLAQKIIIDLEMRLGYHDTAMSKVTELNDQGNADQNLLLSISDQLLKSGRKDEAKVFIESSDKLSGIDAEGTFKQALMQLRVNDETAAIASLEKTLELDPTLNQAEQILAAGYVSNGDFDNAFKIVNKWKSATADETQVNGYILAAAIYEKQKQSAKAQDSLKQAKLISADNTTVLFKLAQYVQRDKNYDLAINQYQAILDIQPAHLSTIKQLVLLSLTTEENKQKIKQNFIDNIAKLPNESALQQGLASFHLANKENKEAIAVLESLKQKDLATDNIHYNLGYVYLADNNIEKAITEFELHLKKDSRSLAAVEKLLALYQVRQLHREALTLVKATLVHYPKSPNLMLQKVYFNALLSNENSKQDLQQVKNNEQLQTIDLYHKTFGVIAFEDKDFTLALKYFKQAYLLNKNSINAINYAKLANIVEQSPDSAITILETHLTEVNNSQAVVTMLADAYLMKNDYTAAIKHYQTLIELNPKHTVAFNNLAYLNLQQGNFKASLAYAEKAVVLAPDMPAVLDTYAQALAKNNKKQAAIEQFDKALVKAAGNVEISINKAKVLIELKLNDAAQKLLSNLTKANEAEQKTIDGLLEAIK